MVCRALVVTFTIGAAALPAATQAYEIKPKTPDSAFSAKLRPDILGLSADSTADSGPVRVRVPVPWSDRVVRRAHRVAELLPEHVRVEAAQLVTVFPNDFEMNDRLSHGPSPFSMPGRRRRVEMQSTPRTAAAR